MNEEAMLRVVAERKRLNDAQKGAQYTAAIIGVALMLFLGWLLDYRLGLGRTMGGGELILIIFGIPAVVSVVLTSWFTGKIR